MYIWFTFSSGSTGSFVTGVRDWIAACRSSCQEQVNIMFRHGKEVKMSHRCMWWLRFSHQKYNFQINTMLLCRRIAFISYFLCPETLQADLHIFHKRTQTDNFVFFQLFMLIPKKHLRLPLCITSIRITSTFHFITHFISKRSVVLSPCTFVHNYEQLLTIVKRHLIAYVLAHLTWSLRDISTSRYSLPSCFNNQYNDQSVFVNTSTQQNTHHSIPPFLHFAFTSLTSSHNNIASPSHPSPSPQSNPSMASSWWAQLAAVLHRNFLVKTRDVTQTVQEIFLPVWKPEPEPEPELFLIP